MTAFVAALLALNVILHGAIVARHSVKGNEPPLVFGIAYAALAIAVFLAVPYAIWATLIVSVVGTVGLLVAFRSIAHEKTIEQVIIVLNVAIILLVAYLLFWS